MEETAKKTKDEEGQKVSSAEKPAEPNACGSEITDSLVTRPKENPRKKHQQMRKQSKEGKPDQEHDSENAAFIRELENEHFIIAVKKLKNPDKYADSHFYCEICNVALEKLSQCKSHINGKAHKKHKKTKGRRLKLCRLPHPSQHQLTALEALLEPIISQHGLDPKADHPIRQKIAEELKHIIAPLIPGSSVSLYGSSLTCFGFKTSEVNLDLSVPDEIPIPQALLTVLEILQKNENCINVKEEFDRKVPQIVFVHKKTGLSCELSCGNDTASSTSVLLKRYVEIDPVVWKLTIALRYWAKVCAIDRQDEGSLPTYSFALMVINFLQRSKPPVLPKLALKEEKYNKQNLQSCRLGLLWFKLFRYYCVEFDMEDRFVSIKPSQSYYREDKKWGHNRLAIEDPFSPKRNVASSLCSAKVFEYVMDCFETSFLYFGTSRDEKKSVLAPQLVPSWHTSAREPSNDIEVGEEHESNEEEESEEDNISRQKSSQQKATSKTENPRDETDDANEEIFEMEDLEDGCDAAPDSNSKEKANTTEMLGNMLEDDMEKLCLDEVETKVVFKFDARILNGGRKPEVMCCYCKKDGHIRDKCPDLRKEVMKPLPHMTPVFLQILNAVCLNARANLAFAVQEVHYREGVLSNLEAYIHEVFPDSRLHLFGSSVNGFGFKSSDLDICMTFDGKTKDDVNCISIITQLAKKLKQHRDCRNVLPITTAKVPIVKFFLRSVGREGDISLYNILALENTRMLRTYTGIDDKVSALGYTLKLFAKVCDIGDASKGSLSSYAYILMLLHYLQKCQPPVVPVLQELYQGPQAPRKMVEGWNCWFYSDLSNLNTVWKSHNKESVGSLWVGFLRFYTEVFDWDHDVVCCRRTKTLTKFEKMWTKHVFAIEDPFNLDHNLGAGINRRMADFIFAVFKRARERFGSPFHIPLQFADQYFFNADFLTDGALAPVDRNCRVCGRIGHIARECSMSQKNRFKERKREEEERKAEARGERSRLSNRPFAQVDLTPRNRAASSPVKAFTKSVPPEENRQVSGSLPINATSLETGPPNTQLSKQPATPQRPVHEELNKTAPQGQENPPEMPKQLQTQQTIAKESKGLSSPQAIQEPHNLAQMAAMAREGTFPKYPIRDVVDASSPPLMRPDEFLSPPRPTRAAAATRDSPVVQQQHMNRPDLPHPLAPGAERTQAMNKPHGYPLPQQADPRIAWVHMSPGRAWSPGNLNPCMSSPQRIPGRQRSLSESMNTEQRKPGQNVHQIVGSAPSRSPYSSPPGIPIQRQGFSPPGRPVQVPPPQQQSQLLWQQQQLRQPHASSHMTGDQFLDMIRLAESSQAKKQSPTSNQHKNRSNGNDLPGEEFLLKANPLMKSPRTEDERDLFSKLDKVRNLWTGENTQQVTQLRESQASNENSDKAGTQAHERPETLNSGVNDPEDEKLDNIILQKRSHSSFDGGDDCSSSISKVGNCSLDSGADVKHLNHDSTGTTKTGKETISPPKKQKTLAKVQGTTSGALFDMKEVEKAYSSTTEAGFKFEFEDPSLQLPNQNNGSVKLGVGAIDQIQESEPAPKKKHPRSRTRKGKGKRTDETCHVSFENPKSSLHPTQHISKKATKESERLASDKQANSSAKGFSTGEERNAKQESNVKSPTTDSTRRPKEREFHKGDKKDKGQREQKIGEKTSPTGSSVNKKASSRSSTDSKMSAGSSGGKTSSDAKMGHSPGGRGKGRGRARGKGRGQGQHDKADSKDEGKQYRSQSTPNKPGRDDTSQ